MTQESSGIPLFEDDKYEIKCCDSNSCKVFAVFAVGSVFFIESPENTRIVAFSMNVCHSCCPSELERHIFFSPRADKGFRQARDILKHQEEKITENTRYDKMVFVMRFLIITWKRSKKNIKRFEEIHCVQVQYLGIHF